MNKLTANNDRIEKVRSRLDILPPPSPDLPPVANAVSAAPKQKKSSSASQSKTKSLLSENAESKNANSANAIRPVAGTTRGEKRRAKVKKSLPTSTPVMATEAIDAELVDAELVPAGTQKTGTQLPTRTLSGEQQLEAITNWHESSEEEQTLVEQVTEFSSGGLTSFVVHTLLLIILAILTMGTPEKRGVMLSLSNVDTETPDSNSVEISVNLEPIEEASASELEDDTLEDLSLSETFESLEAQEIDHTLEDFGIETLSGSGADSKLNDGGSKNSASKGKKGVKGESIDFFGAYAKGTRFVFVIDCSGSMVGERWRRAKYELERSINELGDEQKFCIILYNSFTTVMMDSKQVQLIKCNDSNKDDAFRWLNRQYPGGGTFPQQAMTMALAENPDAIFLLSDGEIQDNTAQFLVANNKKRDMGQGEYGKIPVHTIALLSTFGQRMLKSIADDNAGTFTRVGRR